MAIHTDSSTRVWEITIDRPQVRNAIDAQHARYLYDSVKGFEASTEHSVAIVYGKGGHFCAGADLHEIAKSRPNPLNHDGDLGPMGPTRLKLTKPIIAAIDGYAVAGGLELACWCDLRVVSETARFGVFCRRVGVPLIDGGTFRLPRLIGQARALDLIMTGREIDAHTALNWGLVSCVVNEGLALATARTMAHQLSDFPQSALRADRLSVLNQWGMSEAEALNSEFQNGISALTEGKAGAVVFSQKR